MIQRIGNLAFNVLGIAQLAKSAIKTIVAYNIKEKNEYNDVDLKFQELVSFGLSKFTGPTRSKALESCPNNSDLEK